MPRRRRSAPKPDNPYVPAGQEVATQAAYIAKAHHEHLAECRIVYLFRITKWQSKGRPQFGQCKKASDFDKALARLLQNPEPTSVTATADIVIILNQSIWSQVTEDVREAVLDHELRHIERKVTKAGKNVWSVAPHDVEEFADIVRRHGLWQESLKLLDKAAREHAQRSLPGMTEAKAANGG